MDEKVIYICTKCFTTYDDRYMHEGKYEELLNNLHRIIIKSRNWIDCSCETIDTSTVVKSKNMKQFKVLYGK